MQTDVTLVGGSTPAASLPTVPSPQKMTAQASITPPVALAPGQVLPKPSSTGQTAAVTEAKIALAPADAPTALSQAERVLKPYGVTMLPDPQVDQRSPAAPKTE